MITEPGNYTLGNDLEGSETPCLVIKANHVTLDGANHSVVQTDSTTAVRVTGVNIKVYDVRVTGGVEYSSGQGSFSQVSASGGKLFIDVRLEKMGGQIATKKTIRVSDGGSSAASSNQDSVSATQGSVSSSHSGPSNFWNSTPTEALLLKDGRLPPICGPG